MGQDLCKNNISCKIRGFMKLGDVFLLVLLVIMWVTVSMHILELHELDGHTFLRTDVVLLPIGISVTVYIFWSIFKSI